MFGIHDLALFVVSGFLLNVTPGPDNFLIMARGASQGWRAGSVAAFGIGTGTFVHILAAALGLSAILATSSTAFAVVKYLGAAYLLWFGLSMIFRHSKPGDERLQSQTGLPYRQIFFQGFMTNALNPKVALFFLAFMPQFIAADSPNKAFAFVLLGCIFNFNSMLWCNFLALFSAFAGQRVRVSGSAARWLNGAIGALFVSFAVRLALVDQEG